MQNLILSLNLVAPVFLLVGIGYFLKRIEIINDNFVSISSKVVFSVSLPALIFSEISNLNFEEIFDLKLVVFIYILTIVSFILIWIFAIPYLKNKKDRAAFIQGSFRGNFAIIGLAIIVNVYGNNVLGKASLLLAFIIPLYNILSVIVLTVGLKEKSELKLTSTIWEILKNPLILAVVAALPFSYFHIQLNFVVTKSISYLAALTLPLALIGIGGFLSFKGIRKDFLVSLFSTVIKIVLIPAAAVYAAYLLGFKDENIGLIFILFSCPTAIASFIMADAMGANSRLAAHILLMTTLGSIVSITLGLFILKQNGLM